MRTLIYSDVHGNLPAFEQMLKVAEPCEQYICLGDLVNYGPWSNECIDLAMSLPNAVLIIGNHEEAFLAGKYPGHNELVKQFFAKTFDSFKRLTEISHFLPTFSLDNYRCTHTILNQNIYPDTVVSLDDNYIIGHSHHQFKYENNNFRLYNAGSVGQNRRFINVINYLIYDHDTQEIEMKNAVYPLEKLLNEMIAQNYPSVCLTYYQNKLVFSL